MIAFDVYQPPEYTLNQCTIVVLQFCRYVFSCLPLDRILHEPLSQIHWLLLAPAVLRRWLNGGSNLLRGRVVNIMYDLRVERGGEHKVRQKTINRKEK